MGAGIFAEVVRRIGTDLKIEAQRKVVETVPRKFTKAQVLLGLDDVAHREVRRLDSWRGERKAYAEYATIRRLPRSLTRRLRSRQVQDGGSDPRKSLGSFEFPVDLQQRHAVGPADGHLALNPDGCSIRGPQLPYYRLLRRPDVDLGPATIFRRTSRRSRWTLLPSIFARRCHSCLPPINSLIMTPSGCTATPTSGANPGAQERRSAGLYPRLGHLSMSQTSMSQAGVSSASTALPGRLISLELFEDPAVGRSTNRASRLAESVARRTYLA